MLNNAKEITIPEGSVKKITDGNGRVIWGSQSAFPYRKLRYIHFSGSERIDTLESPKQSYYYLDAVVPNTSQSWSWIWGARQSISGSYYLLLWQTDGNVIKSRLKSDTQSTSVSTSNSLREFRLRIYDTNNTSGHFWRGLIDMTGIDVTGTPDSSLGTQLWALSTNNSSYAVNLNNYTTTISIGQRHTGTSWDSTANMLIGDVYRYYVRQTTDSSALTHLMFPCQRKSDNKCGLYDTVTNTFYPMEGTDTTTTAAGPVLDEYWDLTAPN